MAGPLQGVRILDLTSMISGPVTTMMLADQGADVIKVENPRGGDFTRAVSTRREGFSATYINNNRNKRSIALNLKDPRGVETLKRLAQDCDVMVQNFRPGVVDRMGIGEADIRTVAPSIIYVSISGFGKDGPYAQKPVYDPLVQALSGLTTVQAGSDEVRPRLVRTILPDKLTGYAGAQAITAALFARERTGEGQHITLSMLDTVIAFLWNSDMGAHTFVGDELKKETSQSFNDLIYETGDGYISVAVQSDKEWAGLARVVDKPEWLEDPRFANAALRHKNIDARLELTQEVLRNDTTASWLERLEAEDVPCAPVLKRREMIHHPQVVANDMIVESDHPVAGRVRQARLAPRFSGTPSPTPHPAPGLGDDTVSILGDAGFSADEIDALISDGVAVAGRTS
ncbi:MAG: CaiB/BaiF CoA transferase family protein [Hyphomicrobiaceae bacterium]